MKTWRDSIKTFLFKSLEIFRLAGLNENAYKKKQLFIKECQGRIQDLSEGGGARFILEPKNKVLGTKRRAVGKNFFFDLKDSKRVKIND